VACLDCGARLPRTQVQQMLAAANPAFLEAMVAVAPDGDADLEADFGTLVPPACTACGGLLKPDVVFYGAAVPRERADAAMAAVQACDALLVVGSSLMVRSSFRLCEAAHAVGRPIAAVNIGRTRADALFGLKLEADCTVALPRLLEALD
jgi:NAD-dependent SIR2 family protein deacetylase